MNDQLEVGRDLGALKTAPVPSVEAAGDSPQRVADEDG